VLPRGWFTPNVSAIEHLTHDNELYVGTFPGPRPLRPRLRMAVVTCMDSRLDLFGALGLNVGDAHLLRNAGGMATEDMLRSLTISQRKLGTSEIAVIHHTDCGMFELNDSAFRSEIEAETGHRPTWDVPGFSDYEQGVRDAVEQIRACDWLPARNDVAGFVFDVRTARLTPVD
jgi:carbonic anhydrase